MAQGPAWSGDGRALYFLDRTGAMMKVPVSTKAAFEFGGVEKVFDGVSALAGYAFGRNYDIAPDGRFLMIKDQLVGRDGRPIELTVALNWFYELNAKSAQSTPQQ